ncbi:unnamed protein product [Amaranthus hypochondriacus]
MAFWFWLEDNHLPSIITRLLRASNYIVNKVFDEALICLNSLAPNQPMPTITCTNFTTTIMGNNIPLQNMHRNKFFTINRIKYFLNDVCARIFSDILDQIVRNNDEVRQFYEPIDVHGFPHPIFGNVTFVKLPLNELFHVDDLWGWSIPGM